VTTQAPEPTVGMRGRSRGSDDPDLRTSTSPASTSSSTHTCTSTTAAATSCSPAGRSTSSVGSSTTRATRTTTPFASGSTRPACSTYRSTANSSCFPGSGSFRRRATHRGMQIVVVEIGGRPVVVGGDVAVCLASSTSRTPKASCGCLRQSRRRFWAPRLHSGWAKIRRMCYARLPWRFGRAPSASAVRQVSAIQSM
jgi:hypothetical protein